MDRPGEGAAGLTQGEGSSRTYRWGHSLLTIRFGSIVESDAEAIVSSDDYYLTMSGGVSAAIRAAAGPNLRIDAAKCVPAELGDVVVTTAGALPARYVFHAITIGPGAASRSAEEVIESTTRRCVELMDVLALSSIAFPAIGAGAAGFSYEDVAPVMAAVLAEELGRRDRPLTVTIWLHGREGPVAPLEVLAFFEQFARLTPAIAGHEAEPATAPAPPAGERRDQAVELARAQAELASLAPGQDPTPVRDRLEQVEHELRQPALRPQRAFISYAHEDEQHRRALDKWLRVLERDGKLSVWQDGMLVPGQRWEDEIGDELARADVILLLVSIDFLDSDFINAVELARALESAASGDAVVIPIILRECPWDTTDLGALQALPAKALPIAQWDDPDAAFNDVYRGIAAAIEARSPG